MKTKPKKRKKKIFILYYLVIAIVLVISSVFTYSRYTSVISTDADIDVAKWQINVNDENQTYTTEIDLAETLTSTIYNDDGDEKVVPGTSGVIELEIDYEGTQVATYYKISVGDKNLPSNLQLWANEAHTVAFSGTSETLNLSTVEGTTTSKTIYIYWQWDFTTTDETADWMAQSIYASINVEVEQYTT